MYEIIWLYVIMAVVFGIIFFWMWCDEKDKKYDYFLSPKYIYENTKMNVLGVIFSTIFLFILSPFYYIFLFIYWIFHIGRKS